MKVDYPSIKNAAPLLAEFKAESNLADGTPSKDAIAFLDRIANADPADPTYGEDDLDSGWGHNQFVGGAMTITTTLTSWSAIGNVDFACKLIAAAIRTCQVARHLCFKKKLTPMSYLSDCYLENLLDVLWKNWKDAKAVSLYNPIFTQLNYCSIRHPLLQRRWLLLLALLLWLHCHLLQHLGQAQLKLTCQLMSWTLQLMPPISR